MIEDNVVFAESFSASSAYTVRDWRSAVVTSVLCSKHRCLSSLVQARTPRRREIRWRAFSRFAIGIHRCSAGSWTERYLCELLLEKISRERHRCVFHPETKEFRNFSFNKTNVIYFIPAVIFILSIEELEFSSLTKIELTYSFLRASVFLRY